MKSALLQLQITRPPVRGPMDKGSPITPAPFPAVLIAAAVIALSAGCSKEEDHPAPARPVRIQILESGISEPFRRFPGEVSAVRNSEMSFDVAGRLIERPATQGMIFSKGSLLARLDPENFQARVDSTTAQRNNARNELARQRQLHERGVISVAELDRFQTNFDVAEAALREATRALDDTRLVAPFDGRVARTLVNNFQSVQANQPILLFQDISTLEVDIDVPEQVMTRADQGLTADNARDLLEGAVEFATLPGQRFPLALKSFSSAASPTARTFRVTFTLEPPEGSNILPGMTCTVLVRARGADESADRVFTVPVQAVAAQGEASTVWVLNPETMTVSPVPVTVESLKGDSMVIRSEGLQNGTEIVTTGIRFLEDGMPVERLPR
jgi:membrane fusion protein, multidrug efflux system